MSIQRPGASISHFAPSSNARDILLLRAKEACVEVRVRVEIILLAAAVVVGDVGVLLIVLHTLARLAALLVLPLAVMMSRRLRLMVCGLSGFISIGYPILLRGLEPWRLLFRGFAAHVFILIGLVARIRLELGVLLADLFL